MDPLRRLAADKAQIAATRARVEIIAHRGSSHLAPENTLASFRLGWQETTTCELDIRQTWDGRLLVIHDESTKRTTGVNYNVAEHSLAELQKLDAGSLKEPKWKGEKLPSLEEVIAAMPADKRLLIEVKNGPEVVPELVRVICASGKESQLLIQSFAYAFCVEARKELPHVPIYLLIASRHNPLTGAWSPSIDEVLLKIEKAGLDGIGVDDTALVNGPAIQRIHSAGLKINIWTVDQVDGAKRLIDMGIDGLITNRPGWLKAQLAEAR